MARPEHDEQHARGGDGATNGERATVPGADGAVGDGSLVLTGGGGIGCRPAGGCFVRSLFVENGVGHTPDANR